MSEKLLGDFVADVIKAVTGKEPCEPCKRRKQALNDLHRKVLPPKAKRGR